MASSIDNQEYEWFMSMKTISLSVGSVTHSW